MGSEGRGFAFQIEEFAFYRYGIDWKGTYDDLPGTGGVSVVRREYGKGTIDSARGVNHYKPCGRENPGF